MAGSVLVATLRLMLAGGNRVIWPYMGIMHAYLTIYGYNASWLRLRLAGGAGGSVPVAMPHSVHSTCIGLQLSHATTSYPYPS